MSDRMVTAHLSITRYLDHDGHPCVEINTDDGGGNSLPIIEVLGMLSFATADAYAEFPMGDTDE